MLTLLHTMFLASSLDPDIVHFGRAVGFILFLGVLPSAVIIFVVTGIKLISRRTKKRIVVFIVSGLVSAALLLPVVLVFRGVLTSHSFGTGKQTQTMIKPQSQIQRKPADQTEIVSSKLSNNSWKEFTGIDTVNKRSIMSATELYKQFSPAVVTIVTEAANSPFSGNQKSMQGTGLILQSPQTSEERRYWLMTCYHIVRGMRGHFVLQNSKGNSISASTESAIVDKENDWCLVPLQLESKSEFYDLPDLYMKDAPPEVGEDIFTIGTPEGMNLTLSKGIVSSLRHLVFGNWVQTTCPMSFGSSGSPAFDSNGAFVGIAVQSLTEGQNINFLVSSQTMQQRINEGKLSKIIFSKKTASDFLPRQLQNPSLADNAKSPGTITEFLAYSPQDSTKRAAIEGIRTEIQYDTGWDTVSTPHGNRFRMLTGANEIKISAPSSDHINEGVRNANDYPLTLINDARGLIWQYPVGLGNFAFVCKKEVVGDLVIYSYESDSLISKSKGTLTINAKNNTFVEEVEQSMPPINGVSIRRFIGKGKIASITIDD